MFGTKLLVQVQDGQSRADIYRCGSCERSIRRIASHCIPRHGDDWDASASTPQRPCVRAKQAPVGQERGSRCPMGTAASNTVAPRPEPRSNTTQTEAMRWQPAPPFAFARSTTLPAIASTHDSLQTSRGSVRTSSALRSSSFALPGLGVSGGPRTDSIHIAAATQISPLATTETARAATEGRNHTDGCSDARSRTQTSVVGGLQRKLSNSKLLKQTTVAAELWKELWLVKRNLFSSKPWLDGLSVMWIVLSNTITSVLMAWLFTLVYAVGWPCAPLYSPARTYSARASSSNESLLFTATSGAYFVAFACGSHAVAKCHTLAERLESVHTTLRHAFRRTLTGYVCVVAPFAAAASATGVGVMAVLDRLHVEYTRCGRIQLLLLGFVVSLYIDYMQRHAARIRRRLATRMAIETTNGLTASARSSRVPSVHEIGAALDSSSALQRPATGMAPLLRISTMARIMPRTQSKSMLQRFIRGRRGFAVICTAAMFAYLHLSLALALQYEWQVLVFAAFSLLLKISIQEATKRSFLPMSTRPSARTTHMIMTLPTVMVDAQIRMVFVQLGHGSSSSAFSSSVSSSTSSSSSSPSSVLTSSFIIVICKVCFRLAKILRLRATLKHRLSHSKGMQRILKRVNSKVAVRDIAIARAEYAQFLDWKNDMLRLHAAEVYADMHGEYISIGLAMAVVYFLTDHPMYALRQADDATVASQLCSGLVQLATALAFDYLASVVEGVHEVPLYEAIGDEGRGLRVYMHVLLGAITVVNVGIVTVFLLTSSTTTTTTTSTTTTTT